MKKLLSILESPSATFIGGIFLICSLLISVLFQKDLPILADPSWISVFVSGIPLFHNAVSKLVNNKGISKISSSLLISISMVASIIIGDIFAAGEIAFIMALGEILEDKTTDKAKKGLKNLIDITPVTARKISEKQEIPINAEEIVVGNILRILPGEKIPADGIIISGETSVDQSVMTGESLPVDKSQGDSVFCGTINLYGSIDIEATKSSVDSSLQRLIKLVKDAEKKSTNAKNCR